MKRYLIFAGIALLTLLSGCFFGDSLGFTEEDAKGKENLLWNGSFESGEYAVTAIPEGWMVLDRERFGPQILWISEDKKDEDRAVIFKDTAGSISLISSPFTLYPRAAYYFRCYLKSDAADPSEVTVRFIAFDNHEKKTDQYIHEFIPGREWTRAEFSAAYFKNTAVSARIILTVRTKPEETITLDQAGVFEIYRNFIQSK